MKTKRHQISIGGIPLASGSIRWECIFDGELPSWDEDREEGLYVFIRFSFLKKKDSALEIFKMSLLNDNIEWIGERENRWWIDIDKFCEAFKLREASLRTIHWLDGIIYPFVEISAINKDTLVQFIATKEKMAQMLPKKIFLSHKSVDKPVVREYFDLLKAIGFDPWIDEDAMTAGVSLERALLDGMKNSCASVFFVTSNYQDERYLATEIDYAVSERRSKGENHFTIITLVLQDSNGEKGKVPELLKPYVWKEPKSHLEAMKEIIKALPVYLSDMKWKKI